jgi:site-specific DNA recombinase
MTAPVRAAAYYRRSTDMQEHSFDRQRSQVEPLAKRQGYIIVRTYEDDAIAGDHVEKRKGFCRMLEDAKRGLFSVILCDSKDRFGRFDLIDAGEVIAPLRRAGVRLHTAAEGLIDWDSFAGRITDAILQEAKRQEVRELSRRIASKMLMKVQNGTWVPAVAPYGLKVVEADGRKRLVPGDPDEVKVVKFIFDAIANRGRRPAAAVRPGTRASGRSRPSEG